ncbi:MAG: GNAT family N-acetyltransferase [Anaerolineae bacterium]|nr:GNAT family N-acetyltransferase [Anaerolineae bacterium]
MTTAIAPVYRFDVEVEGDDEFKRYLQRILNEHHETAYPLMEVPKSKRFMIRVTDEAGVVVGGALIWAYWGWLDFSLIALEKKVRGRGLGRQLMAVIEEKAREEGCTRIRVEAFEHEVGFYQRMGFRVVGQLEDYPEGHSYYWMRKDLQ